MFSVRSVGGCISAAASGHCQCQSDHASQQSLDFSARLQEDSSSKASREDSPLSHFFLSAKECRALNDFELNDYGFCLIVVFFCSIGSIIRTFI